MKHLLLFLTLISLFAACSSENPEESPTEENNSSMESSGTLPQDEAQDIAEDVLTTLDEGSSGLADMVYTDYDFYGYGSEEIRDMFLSGMDQVVQATNFDQPQEIEVTDVSTQSEVLGTGNESVETAQVVGQFTCEGSEAPTDFNLSMIYDESESQWMLYNVTIEECL